jgi:hypothetical protein
MRAVCLFVSLVIAAPAQAERTDEGAAKAHFAAGKSFFKDKRYRDAVGEFLEAYRLSSANDLLYNLAVCYDALDDAGRASLYFQRYLAGSLDPPERAQIEQALRRLSSRVGRLIIHAPPESLITVDGIALEVVPPAPLLVSAGSHHIVARLDGAPLGVVDATVASGLAKEVTIAAPPAVVVAPLPVAVAGPERAPAGRTLKLVGIALLGIGGAALIGGVTGSALAVEAGNDVSNESRMRAAFDPSLQSRGQRAALAGDVLYGVGGAALVSGVVLTVVGVRAARAHRATAALVPLALPGAAGVLVQGSFQ